MESWGLRILSNFELDSLNNNLLEMISSQAISLYEWETRIKYL